MSADKSFTNTVKGIQPLDFKKKADNLERKVINGLNLDLDQEELDYYRGLGKNARKKYLSNLEKKNSAYNSNESTERTRELLVGIQLAGRGKGKFINKKEHYKLYSINQKALANESKDYKYIQSLTSSNRWKHIIKLYNQLIAING
jgi:hypothetical protein